MIGRKLGNYKIIDKLGAGGMATVYVGYQEVVDRQVAVKVLPPHPGLDSGFVERFHQEARTIAKLQHPHILSLFDYGNQDDIIYLVMAFVEGGTLEDRIAEGGMQLRTIEKILREVAGALDYAHRQGVIHRDIKPANILMDSEGHALLADFGIAKLAESGANLTGTAVVGTPAYMSPEQAQGIVVDPRADVYSLGVVVYQMLTGNQPFDAPSAMQLILKIIQEPPPNVLETVPSLPEELGAVMVKVMAKDPDERYQTASDFAEAFSQAIHEDRESLAAVRAALPLEDRPTEIREKATFLGGQVISKSFDQTTGQTVIVQQGVSPLVLLGGFAIIAIALVLVVLVIVNNNNKDNDGDGTPVAQITPTDEIIPTNIPVPTVPTFGEVSFSTASTLGDTISVRVTDLAPVGNGEVYVAWLVNVATGETFKLGEVVVDGLGTGALTFTSPDGVILPTLYNAVYITRETDASITALQGEAVYVAGVPSEIGAALQQILIASEDGLGGGSLLDGARTEAEIAFQHAGLASNSTNAGGMHNHAEHTINILTGDTQDWDNSGSGSNPGRGVGVYAFTDLMEGLIVDAVSVDDATVRLQIDAEILRVCLENTRVRADRIIELEHELLAADDVAAVQDQAAESTLLAEQIITGFDLNENGRVDPFEGECGLDQVETYALLIASMDIVEAGNS
mgnify:CR=1 FL=1